MKVTLNANMCLGCKRCVKICKEVFKMDGEKAVVILAETNLPKAVEASEDCPAGAIKVE